MVPLKSTNRGYGPGMYKSMFYTIISKKNMLFSLKSTHLLQSMN